MFVDRIYAVPVTVFVEVQGGGTDFRVQQAHFVVIRVAHGSHEVTAVWPGHVQFDVQTKTLSGMRDLHDAGDAAVVIRVPAHEIGGLRLDKIHVRFQAAHVLKLEQRCLDELA